MGGDGSCPPSPSTRTAYLCHLLLPLSFGRLGVGVVVALDQNEVVGLGVDDKLPGCILKGESHLVEDGTQLLQRQNSEKMKGERHMVKAGQSQASAKARLSSIVVKHTSRNAGLGADATPTSACWWKWPRCLLGTAQRQSRRRTPEFRRTEESGESETGRSN